MLNKPITVFVCAFTVMAMVNNAQAATMKWCTTWLSQYVDSGHGENWYTSTSPTYRAAHYTYARVTIVGDQGTVWQGPLDEDGCTPRLPLQNYTHYKFRQFTRAQRDIEGQDSRIIYVNPDDSPWGPHSVSYNSYYLTSPVVQGDFEHTFHPSVHNSKTNLMPIMGKILRNYHTRNFPAGEVMYVQTDYNASRCYGTMSTDNGVCILDGANGGIDRTSWKFVVAHEMGHQQASAAGGPTWGDYEVYGDSWVPAVCKCDHVSSSNQLHCFQSLEYIDTAAKEGYAQFYSAATFNNTSNGFEDKCGFAYYKEMLTVQASDLHLVELPPISIDCDVHKRHMRSHCNPDMENYGVEGDWQSFFWRLWQVGPNNFTMAEISDLWEEAFRQDSWDYIIEAAASIYGENHPKYYRLIDEGHAAGIGHPTFPPGQGLCVHDEDCYSQDHCSNKICCSSTGGLCCNDELGRGCPKGSACNNDIFQCEPLAPNGEFCQADSDCASDFCDHDICSEAITLDLAWDEIQGKMTQLADEFPNLVQIQQIGSSWFGRPMQLVILGTRQPGNQIVWVTAGHAAHQWPTQSAQYWVLREFLISEQGRALLEDGNIDIYVVPVINPDGNAHSHESERAWRKNREANQGSSCIGTDLNRNWPVDWDEVGSSPNPCSNIYRGQHPLSAPETSAVANYAWSVHQGNTCAYLDFHDVSYLPATGDMYLLTPGAASPPAWYTGQAHELNARCNFAFDVPPANIGGFEETFFTATGTALDWFHYELGAQSLLVEMNNAVDPVSFRDTMVCYLTEWISMACTESSS